jgi:hypothetical protein
LFCKGSCVRITLGAAGVGVAPPEQSSWENFHTPVGSNAKDWVAKKVVASIKQRKNKKIPLLNLKFDTRLDFYPLQTNFAKSIVDCL